MGLRDIIGYKSARNLSKFILLISAIAISTFAMVGFVFDILNTEFFFPVKNYIAISIILVGFLIKDDVLTPPHILDKGLSKIVYYGFLGAIALAISTIQFSALVELLNTTFFGFDLLAVRNIVAVILLISVRNIHNAG